MDAWTPPNAEHAPPKRGEPPLHRAAREGDHDTIRALVVEGADLDAVWDIGLDPGAYPSPATPLMVAAGSGDGATLATVELLLGLGADPTRLIATEGIDGALSAATYAASGLGWNYRPGGDADRLRRLLAAGAPLPPEPADANRTLCHAAERGDVEMLRLLLARGLDPRGHWDATAEAEAAARDEAERAELLADFDEDLGERFPSVFPRRTAGAPSYEIPLHCAAESGDLACVRALLDAGADPLVRDDAGESAIFTASSEPVVRALIALGLSLDERNAYGWSPLVDAISDAEEGLPRVRALLAAGADPNATHDHGYTVLMSAVGSNRHPEVLRALVAAGADPHTVSEYGYNAFHAAIDVNGEANEESSVRDTLSYLKALGVDLERRTNGGQTPLARAISEGTATEVRVLLEIGADPNAPARVRGCGSSSCVEAELPPLLQAVVGSGVDRDEKIAALLAAGADPLARDAEGFTALDRMAATLCGDAAESEATYHALFAFLGGYWGAVAPESEPRSEFVARHVPRLRLAIARFAAPIPIPIQSESEYAAEWREETIAALAHLSVHDAWARRRG